MMPDATATAERLVERIKPLLAHHDPEIVGATLGQLLAILVAGHHPTLRDGVLRMTLDMVRALVPIEIEIMIDAGQVGPEWRGRQQ